MRNVLILLVVVALLILAVGALNNGVAFDVGYVAGTANAVSLFWVSAVVAALVFVVGLAAAWFARAATTGSRRKLEAELQATYERLREAEALAARPAPAVATAARAAEDAAATVVAAPVTVAEHEDVTVVADEAATRVDPVEATTTIGEAPADESTPVIDGPPSSGEAGEQTAVTMAGAAVPDAPVGDAEVDAGAPRT